ncbi:hypothetical protein E8E11_008445 [Didymella keratinophila]|nr:hypothetical protein E8E11_008445 [Didymella keratinophila]
MPPKKKTEADTEPTATGEAGDTIRILLLLCFDRNPDREDYQKFVDALPAGAFYNGELGWEIPEVTTPKAKAEPKTKTVVTNEPTTEEPTDATKTTGGKAEAKTPAKRKTSADAKDDETAKAPKSKKPRAKKGEGKKKGAVKSEEVEEDGEPEEGVVKEEGDEEAV